MGPAILHYWQTPRFCSCCCSRATFAKQCLLDNHAMCFTLFIFRVTWFICFKRFLPWYLPQQGKEVGNQDPAFLDVVPKLMLCPAPTYPVLIGRQLKCQDSLALRNTAHGSKLILEKPMRAQELECPVSFAVENQLRSSFFFSQIV